jgi:hypothetical protein
VSGIALLENFPCATAVLQAWIIDILLVLTRDHCNRNSFEVEIEEVPHYAVFPEAAVSASVFADLMSAL